MRCFGLGQFLAELWPVGVLSDDLPEDNQGCGMGHLRLLRSVGEGEHVPQVALGFGQFQAELGVVGEVAFEVELLIKGQRLGVGRLGFRQPIVVSEESTGPEGTSGNMEWELEYAALRRALLNVQGAGNELRVFLRLRR